MVENSGIEPLTSCSPCTALSRVNWALTRLALTKKHHTFLCSASLSGGDYRDRTGDLLHAMQALSRTVSKHTPTRKRGNRLNFALIRSIHQKAHSYILLSGIMLRLQGNFTTQFLSVSMGFAQREGHLREKFFLTAYLAQF